MKRFAALALTAALCLTVAGCKAAEQPAPAPLGAMVSAANAGDTVNMGIGGILTVALPANPSTGYSWIPTDTPAFLFVQGQPTFEASSTSTAVGVGGTEIYKFKAVSAGSAPLLLDYMRPWETTVTPAKNFKITVIVK